MKRSLLCFLPFMILFATSCDSGIKPQPENVRELDSEQLPNGKLRLNSARTEDVEHEGTYQFRVEHCGLDHIVDFDGSFWRAVKPADYKENEDAYPFFYNSDDGTITFEGDDEATYEASTGERITLTRIDGPIEVDLCG